MSDQHHIGHGGFSPYVLTGGTTEERQAHNTQPENLIYACKYEIDRLRRERDEALALLREAQAEIGQQCSIMYNSHASPADGEVHDSEAKVELDRIDDLFRRIGALLASLKGA